MNEKGLTLIKRFKLKNLDNKLYIGFLRDVNHFIEVKTPIALGISNCYENFRQRLEVANDSRQPRSKHPLTAELAKQHDAEAEERRSQIGTGDRSEKIRTYNFPQGRVTDHRIKLTIHRLDSVLNGDLSEIIDSLIAADQAAKLGRLQEKE